MKLEHLKVASSRTVPSFIITRFDDAVKYHVQLDGENAGSVLRFTDSRSYLGWFATPDDCTGGPRSSSASRFRWAGGFSTRQQAVAYLRGHLNAGSAWWNE